MVAGLRFEQRAARLIGRHGELTAFDRAAADALRHGAQIVVVTGEAGIGKTRLLDELRRRHGGQFGVTAFRARRNGSVELELRAAIEPLIGPLAADAVLGDLSAAARAEDTVTAQARSDAALTGAARSVLDGMGERPWLILADDLHWAQPATLRFVELLAGELADHDVDRPVLLVAALRPVPPRHPAGDLVAVLERSARSWRLEPGPLGDEEVLEVLATLGLRLVSPTFLALVQRSARGNPLRVRAAAESLLRRGVTADLRAGDPRAKGRLLPEPGVFDPVAEWIALLESGARKVLAAAATLGDEFAPADAASVAATDRAEVDDAVGSGVAAGIVGSDGRVAWFTHPLLREALEDSVPARDRPALHRRCIEVLTARSHTGDLGAAVALGRHVIAAGDAVHEGDRLALLDRAADAAFSTGAWADSATFREAAIEAAAGRPAAEAVARRWEAARAHYFNHDADAAAAHLDDVITSARALGDEAAWGRAAMLTVRLPTITTADAYQSPTDTSALEEFLASATDPCLRCSALELLAEVLVVGGRVDDGRAAAEEAVALVGRCGDDRTAAMAHHALGLAAAAALELGTARGAYLAAHRHARTAGDWYVASSVQARACFVAFSAGRLAEAERLAQDAAEEAARHREFSAQALGAAVRCLVASLRGDLAEAERLGRRAAEAMRRSRYVGAAFFLYPGLVAARLLDGDLAGAGAALDEWESMGPMGQHRYRELVEAHRHPSGARATGPAKPPRGALTQFGAGAVAVDAEIALRRGDVGRLAVLEPLLAELDRRGVVFPLTWPSAVPRLLAEVRAAVSDGPRDVNTARDPLGAATRLARHEGAQAELVHALLAAARLDPDTDGRRRAAAEAWELAERLGLGVLAERAARQLRQALADAPPAQRPGSPMRLPTRDAAPGTGRDGHADAWRVVLITDIVGSTRVSVEAGDRAYHRLISTHHELVRACLAAHGGVEFADSGDGLLAWFADAGSAASCAQAIQDVAALRPPGDLPLQLRVGLAGGRPLFHDGRPFGATVNIAARIVGLADTGEVLLDEPTAAALDPAATELRGSYTLRHVAPWTPVYRLRPRTIPYRTVPPSSPSSTSSTSPPANPSAGAAPWPSDASSAKDTTTSSASSKPPSNAPR